MKQHATKKQPDELSTPARGKFLDWQIKHGWDIKGELDPVPNIGQLIEFLDVQKIELIDDYWLIGIGNIKGTKWKMETGKELCNVLWAATKEVLEK